MNKQTHYIIRDSQGRYPYWDVHKSKGFYTDIPKGKWVYISFGCGDHSFTNKERAYNRLAEFTQQAKKAGFDISFEVIPMTKDDWMQQCCTTTDNLTLIK